MANSHLMAKMKFGSMQHKQAAQTVKIALQEDPNVFEYDEVYDEMDKKRSDSRAKAKEDRKPKYIAELMKTAEKRQREFERRTEKMAQKEIEKEGDMYQDKEKFVTSAYKKKMEELNRLEEEERKQDAIDELTDVTKQNDLSGFYRHLYKVTMSNSTRSTKTGDSQETANTESTSHSTPDKTTDKTSPEQSSQESNEQKSESSKTRLDYKDHDRSRDYDRDRDHDKHDRDRRHRHSDRSRDQDRRERDSDRHHDRDRRDHRDRDRERYRDQRREHDRRQRSRDRTTRHSNRPRQSASRSPRSEWTKRPEREDDRRRKVKHEGTKENYQPPGKSTPVDDTPEKSSQSNVKLSEHRVWKKRTIGDTYEDARARYLERKESGLVRPIIISEK